MGLEVSLPPVQPLKALLQEWGLESLVEGGLEGMSDELLCRVVPRMDDGDESAIYKLAADGIPVLAPAVCTERLRAQVGPDGLSYLRDPRWATFAQPKVAMVSGWGRPGTLVDAVNDRDLALVHSFQEVLDSPRVLNLQMFHRDDDGETRGEARESSEGAKPESGQESSLPVLPALLDWPCPDFFETSKKNAESDVPPAVRVDRATRVSSGGAITWSEPTNFKTCIFHPRLNPPGL